MFIHFNVSDGITVSLLGIELSVGDSFIKHFLLHMII